jgi:hypothetical protein
VPRQRVLVSWCSVSRNCCPVTRCHIPEGTPQLDLCGNLKKNSQVASSWWMRVWTIHSSGQSSADQNPSKVCVCGLIVMQTEERHEGSACQTLPLPFRVGVLLDRLYKRNGVCCVKSRSWHIKCQDSLCCVWEQAKKKDKVEAMKACRESRGIAPLSLNLGTRWGCRGEYFGPKREELTGRWRKPCSGQLRISTSELY